MNETIITVLIFILIIVLIIVGIGIILWAFERFIAPIPQIIKVAIVVIFLLVLILYVLQSGKLNF